MMNQCLDCFVWFCLFILAPNKYYSTLKHNKKQSHNDDHSRRKEELILLILFIKLFLYIYCKKIRGQLIQAAVIELERKKNTEVLPMIQIYWHNYIQFTNAQSHCLSDSQMPEIDSSFHASIGYKTTPYDGGASYHQNIFVYFL